MADKEWTIMVYMAGDNNLSVEMVYALEQLKVVSQNNPNIDLYVYYDGLSSDVPTLYCDFSNFVETSNSTSPVNFYQSYRIKNKLIDVDDEFNENSAAVDNIINFVDWCVKKDTFERIKEKKYAFIFSGHSFGFINWGLFKDEKSNYYMTHPKLKYMFERITSDQDHLLAKAQIDESKYKERYKRSWSEKNHNERETVILGKKLDLLGFDSCVMSTLELGSQFKKFSKTMVASEGSIPTAGWNYAQILQGKINENPKSEAQDIAVSFVAEFIKQQNKFALADISVDISAWDLTKLPDLEGSFGVMVACLLECFKDNTSTFHNQAKRLLVYTHWRCQTYMLEQHIDLGDFCKILAEEINSLGSSVEKDSPLSNLKDACVNVLKQISECILITGFSGSDFQFSTGISLFFPWSLASYNSAQKDYERLTFIYEDDSAGKKWNEFLQRFLGETTFRESKSLTQTENDESVVVSSIIYESYANMDTGGDLTVATESDNKQPPNTGKQPPNTGKQPPNTGRQPPNTGRMLSDMNIFFSRFMRLKNFEFNWNRTGFISNKVVFKPTSKLASANPQHVKGKIVIEIPKPRNIQKRIDDFFFSLDEFANAKGLNMDELVKGLKEVFQNSDEPTIVEILGGFSKSDFLTSSTNKEEDLKVELKDKLSKSIKFFGNVEIQEEILKNFDKISFKI